MERMPLALSGRTLLTAALTAFNGRFDFSTLVRTVIIWRTVALLVVAVVGTRIACGTALRRGVPSAVGASATGMVLGGVIMVGLSWGHTLLGQLILEADSARSLIDLVIWTLGGIVGLVWAQVRVTSPEPRTGARGARAPSWS